MTELTNLHGTCVSIGGMGVLLFGDSGSGKSDLAIRLIDEGATLVSDDQLQIRNHKDALFVSPVPRIHGMVEARGVGILTLPYTSNVPVALAVNLVRRDEIDRMPEPMVFDCLGVQVPLLSLYAFDISTSAKIRLYLAKEAIVKFVLVTGMSGAGKGVALKTLEDCGFEAIDNLPLAMLPAVANASTRNLAVVANIRNRDFSTEQFMAAIELLKDKLDFSILFLDCDDEVLRRRFTETRRRHPLALDRTVPDGIHHERELIGGLRDIADLVIDTSEYQAAELRQAITSHFAAEDRHLSVVLTSFSFKRGIPREADMVLDVRFLKNPHYDPKLQQLSGLDAAVGASVESDAGFADFYTRITGLLQSLLPRYLDEGKNYLTIAIGCTGGRHRSVYLVQKLGAFLYGTGYNVALRHRDLEQKS